MIHRMKVLITWPKKHWNMKKLSNRITTNNKNTINSKFYHAMKGKYDIRKQNKQYDNKHTMQCNSSNTIDNSKEHVEMKNMWKMKGGNELKGWFNKWRSPWKCRKENMRIFGHLVSMPCVQYSRTFAPQVQTSWNQAHAPLLVKSFPMTPNPKP
jgi:hypothetical protein